MRKGQLVISTKKLVKSLSLALILGFGLSANAQQTAGGIASLYGSFVVAVTVTNGGSGYGWAPSVTFTGGGGAGAAGYSTISGGVVTGITVTNAGFGYTSPPLVTIAPPVNTPYGSSLVLDLTFNGGVTDVGPYGFTIINNGGTFVPNRFLLANSALSVNGVNQNMYIPNNALLYPSNFTFSAWVKFSQFNPLATIWETGNITTDPNAITLNIDPTGMLLGYLDWGGSGWDADISVSTSNLEVGIWNQVVVTRTANACSMFINGVMVASETGLTPYLFPTLTPMSFGAHNNNNGSASFTDFCAVTFDTVHIYNRALTDSEVRSLYTNEMPALVPTVGLVTKTIRVNMMQLVSGQTYQLESSPDLNTWTNLNSSFVATNATAYEDVDILGTATGYFRVVELH
jgi:hypothetical protein